jgi:hypothetical protein
VTGDRPPFGPDGFDGSDDRASDGSVEGHLAGGSRWGSAPERPVGRGLWGRDLAAGAPADAAVDETDALLDRLGARRPHPDDLDHPAVAVLALLATEVDLPAVPADALRAELFARGAWPLVPSGSAPSSFLPETEVLDLRALPADRTAPVGGPAWLPGEPSPFPQPGLRTAFADAARVPAPRQVRVRLVALAACAVVGLYGLVVGVTGAWSPWHAGTIIAGTDEGTQIQEELRGAIQLVKADDLGRGTAALKDAYQRAKAANLTPEQRALVDRLLRDVSAALTDRGVVLPAELRPGAIGVRPQELPVVPPGGPAAVPVATPTGDVPDARQTSSAPATSDAPSEPVAEPSSPTTTSAAVVPEPSTTSTSAPVPSSSSTTKHRPSDKGHSRTSKTRTRSD